MSIKISVIVPIYNEERGLEELIARIDAVLKEMKTSYEIIAIDDGSKDASADVLRALTREYSALKVLLFERNAGQTAAIAAGIESASGEFLVPIDSDLENDPADIPRLIKKMEEGFDVVSGWRKDRWGGQALTRKLPSILANKLISWVTGVSLHDYGCTLKVYRASVLRGVLLYGEMHRFIPAYTAWNGARVTELPVAYHPRKYGVSNYGMKRTFKVLLDLLVFKFLYRYLNRPMHFFGAFGFVSLFIGICAGLAAFFLKLFDIRDFVATPLPVFSALFVIVGVQLVIMGILGELLMRTYYESQAKRPFVIKETITS